MARRRASLATRLASVALVAACTSGSPSSSISPAPSPTVAPSVATTTGAPGECGSGKVKTIGYSPNTLQTEFYVSFGKALASAADKCGIRVIEDDPRQDAAKQTSGIENLVGQGVSAIAVRSVDAKAMGAAVAAAQAKGVHLVALFGTFEGASGTVGPDDTELGGAIGRIAGQALKELKPGKETYNVVILNNDSLGTAIILRRTSMEAAFKEEIPVFTIVANAEALTEEEGNKAMATILQQTRDIDVVLSTNDSSALGAISALESAGLKAGKDLVVAISGSTPRALQSIIDGKTPGGPYADYGIWATTTLRAMLKLADGETLTPEDTALPLSIVTKENAQELYDQLYK